MELKKAIYARRSIRKYKDQEISDDIIKELLTLGMAAPSACNRQPWEFYVIKNKQIIDKLSTNDIVHSFPSPLKIVVCGNKKNFLQGPGQQIWTSDCSAAIENILLGVTDLDLGATWIGVWPNETKIQFVKDTLSLEEDIIPFGILNIGYPNEIKEERSQYDENKIHCIY